MIYYFSGTGNSLWAAQMLAESQGERLGAIADELKCSDNPPTIVLSPEEKLGFVFPVYAWSPPKLVLEFIQKMKITGCGGQYVFAVCTCGDEAGCAMDVLRKALKKRGITLNCGFSVDMPNNYIVAYDVDPEELEQKKLKNAERTLSHIGEVIFKRQDQIFNCKKGRAPLIKTAIVNPVFNLFAMSAKPFYAMDTCISCGLCESICPTNNIKLAQGKPHWGNRCTQCLACIHRCPEGAIQYGNSTKKKGRYYNPNCI